jgi:Tfp pilus assembly protein PilZ
MTRNADRRNHERLKGPFDGSWDGSSGMRTCRITDLSAGGCFIDALASAEVGSQTNIVIELDGQKFIVPARVAYLDRVQGFAVRFEPGEPTDVLAQAVKARLAK